MAKEEEELVEKVYRLLEKKYGDRSVATMRKMFAAYDKNADGKVSSEELEALLKDADVGNALTRRRWISGIVGQLDADGDAHVDWAEFSASIASSTQGSRA